MAVNTGGSFKTITNQDVTNVRSMLHEAIPLTGSIVSGTYGDQAGNERNIKNYSHGMFQSVYDYPYLSSSANHVFDITMGISPNSSFSSSTTPVVQQSKKINIYNQMAQLLVGYDHTGSIREIDRDGNLTGGASIREAFFINFSRLLTKDEIKKGSFALTFLTGNTVLVPRNQLTLQDHGAATKFKTNSPAGEYAVLYTSSAASNLDSGVGLLYYQAGIAVVTASVFGSALTAPGGEPAEPGNSKGQGGVITNYFGSPVTSSRNILDAIKSLEISASANGIRNRFFNLQFNNTVELNSTIYFCRANHNEFNYSASPTYLSASKLVVKNNSFDSPVSYITTVGLYSADNELLAVAKLSEPLKKDPANEFTLRVRLDY